MEIHKSDPALGYSNRDIRPILAMELPTPSNVSNRLTLIDDLKYFLATATEKWPQDKAIKRFKLPTGEVISCILWNNLFFITGTDIVRSLTFRFHAFGRPVTNAKKFEEGIFSDLRNLKPGTDASLEEPKSELLDMLYKNSCIRTQKKQKVFFWYSVPHDRLFLDALERDLKREKMGLEPSSVPMAEPASSLSLDSTQELFQQVRKSTSLSVAVASDLPKVSPPTSLSMSAITQRLPSPVHSRLGQAATYAQTNIGKTGDWIPSQVVPTPSKATTQARRSRVNSLPVQSQQQHPTGHSPKSQTHRYHRMSHASHGSLNKPLQRQRTSSSSSTEEESPRIFGYSGIPHTKTFSFGNPPAQPEIQMEGSINITRSMDPNTLGKKKLFGTMALFEGSPMYKQRRRRAASVTASAATGPLPGAPRSPYPSTLNSVSTQQQSGAKRVRRHTNCHLRTASNPSCGPSHLAMVAEKAGFGSSLKSPPQMMMGSNDYNHLVCPHPGCGKEFSRMDALRHHTRRHKDQTINTPSTSSPSSFTCNVCSRSFGCSDSLAEHCKSHLLESTQVHLDDDRDDAPDDPHNNVERHNIYSQRAAPTVLNHQDNYDGNSLGQYTNYQHGAGGQSVSSGSSRSSTLSPMLDVDLDADLDMQDVSHTINHHYHRSNNSNSSNPADFSVLNNYQHQEPHLIQYESAFQPQPFYQSITQDLAGLSMTYEDCLSPISSPQSHTPPLPPQSPQYNYNPNPHDIGSQMTLLSPFKPEWNQDDFQTFQLGGYYGYPILAPDHACLDSSLMLPCDSLNFQDIMPSQPYSYAPLDLTMSYR
ncbi:STE like transcription factor-domain-containing protein [Phycomyces nitens]|nr:STE like transcription factor-domain-containing protein [Phycomyces nitens]